MAEYFDLTEQLTALIGYPVDLVMSGAVRNPIVRADIDRGKQTLYAA
jgi:predicted nucleotidyltransferase